jgi:hypothetical protein
MVDHYAAEPDESRKLGAFSKRDTVGWLIKPVPLSGSRSQASLKAGDARQQNLSERVNHQRLITPIRDHGRELIPIRRGYIRQPVRRSRE